MPPLRELNPDLCNCLALRQATRHVTQYYDQFLTPTGLRTTQFSILAKLGNRGPLTINALAAEMVMDRTTLGRNIQPLEREGLIAVVTGRTDRRSKELQLTEVGIARLSTAHQAWAKAQMQFEASFGDNHASDLRAILRSVTTCDFGASASAAPEL